MLWIERIFMFVNCFIFASCNKEDIIVKTSLGSIRGIIQTSRNGSDFYSFRGIRYAKALRFKPPIPMEAWNDILDATKDGPACHQTKHPLGFSEDCLRLNIYTRRIHNVDEERPVLFYIHGGAFMFSSGQYKRTGPEYLMDHDLVLVTINYRLGILGFFSTGDDDAPGNYGLKDQVEALKWVRSNIENFGGDPNRITISGQSAGAVSVGFHLVSPMSKGLFHGAMMLSGSPINSWAINKNPIKEAKKQAELLNCTTDNSESMVDCMRKLPVDELINIKSDHLDWSERGHINVPVIEHNGESQRFLEKDPLLSMVQGEIADVPIFIGSTKDEFIRQAIRLIKNKKWATDLSENWNTKAPNIFGYERNDAISEKLREFYLGNSDKPITNDSLETLGNLYSDAKMIFPVLRSAKLLADKNTKPVYLYQFNYVGEELKSVPRLNVDGDRAAHSIDGYYTFYPRNFLHIKFNTTSKDGRFVTKFTTLWKNFVETGNPTPRPSEDLDNVIWKSYTNTHPVYLEINEDLKLINGIYYEDRFLLWDSLFPIPE